MSLYKSLIGIDPDQVPTNAQLGTMAYQDAKHVVIGRLGLQQSNPAEFFPNSVEYTGHNLLFTDTSTKRSVNAVEQFMRFDSGPITTPPIIANTQYNWLRGQLQLEPNSTYYVNCAVALQRTAGNNQRSLYTSFQIPAGATINYIAEASSTVDINVLGPMKSDYVTVATPSQVTDPSNSTTEFNFVRITAVIVTGSDVTLKLIPYISWDAAGASDSVNVLKYSNMSVAYIGAAQTTGNLFVGNWTAV